MGEEAAGPVTREGRIVMIDALRGVAILWVMLFHLGADMGVAGPPQLYPAVRDHIWAGEPVAALRSFGQLVCSLGYQGVPVFMALSGLSLTLSAQRRGERPFFSTFVGRARKLIVPFWAALGLTLSTIATIALIAMLLHGGSYHGHWNTVTLAKVVPVGVTPDDVLYTLSVFGWLFRDKPVTFPVGSLWFVQMLLLYYAVFPFARRVLNRIGPWRFGILALAVTLGARAALIFAGPAWFDSLHRGRYLFSIGLFRGSEFFLGMVLGYLLLHHRDRVREWVSSPLDIAGMVLLALLLQLGGAVLGPKSHLLNVFGDPAIQIALVLLMLPLLFKTPGRLEVLRPAAALAFVGTVAYAALILNDQTRYFASLLREEEVPAAVWWSFLVLVYIPLGTLLAYPLSKALGLLPPTTPTGAASAESLATPPLELQPAGGG